MVRLISTVPWVPNPGCLFCTKHPKSVAALSCCCFHRGWLQAGLGGGLPHLCHTCWVCSGASLEGWAPKLRTSGARGLPGGPGGPLDGCTVPTPRVSIIPRTFTAVFPARSTGHPRTTVLSAPGRPHLDHPFVSSSRDRHDTPKRYLLPEEMRKRGIKGRSAARTGAAGRTKVTENKRSSVIRL